MWSPDRPSTTRTSHSARRPLIPPDLIGSVGAVLVVVPTIWRDGERLVADIDARWRGVPTVDLPERDEDDVPGLDVPFARAACVAVFELVWVGRWARRRAARWRESPPRRTAGPAWGPREPAPSGEEVAGGGVDVGRDGVVAVPDGEGAARLEHQDRGAVR